MNGEATGEGLDRRRRLPRLLRAWPLPASALAAVGLLVAAKLAAVSVPLVLKRVVDLLARPESVAVVPLALLAAYAVLRFAAALFAELRDVVFSRVAHAGMADLTVRVLAHLHALPAGFHRGRAAEATARDVERGAAGVGFLLGMALCTVLPSLLEVAAVTAVLLWLYPAVFALVLLATFLFHVAYTVAYTRRRAIRQRNLHALDPAVHRRLEDGLRNDEAVRLHGNAAHEARRLEATLRRWIESGASNRAALTRLRAGQAAIVAAGVAAMTLLASQGIVAGALGVGDLVLVDAYAVQVCLPLGALGFMWREAGRALAKAGRLDELLAQVPEDGANVPSLAVGAGEVRFEAVSFGYEPARQVLHEVDFTIAPGTMTAIVGAAGAGKSSLARLLPRLHEATRGRVLIDGRDVCETSAASVRRAVGFVAQDPGLFAETIAYNIGYGRPGASQAQIVAAAEAANAHDFIAALPRQYDTVLGEEGVVLAAGERQRIALAREILRDPRILVIDQAAPDFAFREAIERASRGRTALVLAQRLSAVVHADEILVLERGRIVERGRHEALLGRGGLYAQMWSLQRQEGELHRAGHRAARQPVNLASLVAAAIDGLRGAIDERGVHLYTTLSMGAARVNGEPGALQGVVWDLLAHAVQASRAGSRVELRLERAGPEVRLVATHDALGATAGNEKVLGTDRVFDAAALRRVVEEHQGTFTVRREGEGATTHVVTLPLRAVDAHGAMSAAGRMDGSTVSLESRRLLVVDDHDDAREVLAALLEARGAQVEALRSGAAVLERLRGGEPWPDLLVCDIGLPDLDGYTVMRNVRALEAERSVPLEARIPAIALTGYSQHEDRTRALLAGFQLHLAKPVDPDALFAHIADLLARSGAEPSPGRAAL